MFFFDSEVIFTCSKGMYREAHGQDFRAGNAGSFWADGGRTPPTIEGLLHAKLNQDHVTEVPCLNVKEFTRAINYYTARDLTFEEDRVAAFAGLLTNTLEEADPLQEQALIVHGNPLQYLETALTWQQEPGAILRPSIRSAPFASPWTFAPSWSWASAGSQVYFLDDGKNRLFEFSALNDTDIFGMPKEYLLPGFLRAAAGPLPGKWRGAVKLPPKCLLDIREPGDLPQLNLVTIVFGAMLEPNEDGSYTLNLRNVGLPSTIPRARLTLDRRRVPRG